MKWLIVALIGFGAVGCNQTDAPISTDDAARLGLTQTEANNLRMSAMEAARNEKYDVREANFTLRRDGDHYKGYFSPKAKDVLGGELHVIMDKSGRILRIYHGV